MIKFYECFYHQGSACFEKDQLKEWDGEPICQHCFEVRLMMLGDWCRLQDFEPDEETLRDENLTLRLILESVKKEGKNN